MGAHEQEVERRVLALARGLVETLEGRYPNGYEIRDFVLMYHFLEVPDQVEERDRWVHAAYAGWDKGVSFSSTSGNWWVDEMILAEALDRVGRGEQGVSPSAGAAATREEPATDFEQRVAAFLRDYVETTNRNFPDGFEIGDVGIVCELAVAPPADEDLRPWDIGPYAGWSIEVGHASTSRSRWFEAEMIDDVLAYVRERRYPLYTEPDADDEEDDTD